MRILFFDLLPELLDGVEIRRVARQLKDGQTCGLLRKERFQRRTRVVPRAVLEQDEVSRGLRQDRAQKLFVTRAVEFARCRTMKKPSTEIVNQAEDFVAFALARSLHQRLYPLARPSARQCPPLRKTGFIAKQQVKLFSPARAVKLLATRFASIHAGWLRRDDPSGRFLITKPQVLQELGEVKDVVSDAELILNQALNQGRAPTVTLEPALGWPVIKALG